MLNMWKAYGGVLNLGSRHRSTIYHYFVRFDIGSYTQNINHDGDPLKKEKKGQFRAASQYPIC